MNNLPKIQKKNKNGKLNGYLLFARELAGRKTFPGCDLTVNGGELKRAGEPWAKLSENKKQQYRDRANAMNIKLKTNIVKYNSLQEPIKEVEKKQDRMKEEVTAMTNEIKTMIADAADCGELDNLVFYFVSTSHFYKEADVIYPAELALAKFSLKQGVYAKISFPINPGKLPIGSRYTAEQIAKESHNYPLPEDQPRAHKTDYVRLLIKILNFLSPLERLPIFFASGFRGIPKISDQINVIEDTHQVLSFIFEQAGEYEIASKLKVYSIFELLYELKKKIVEFKQKHEDCSDAAFVSIPYTIDKFKVTDSNLEYLTRGCPYHDAKDVSKHCCLSKVQRFGFIISQWCNQMEKSLLKPNQHFPYVPK